MAQPRTYRFPGMDPWLEHAQVWPPLHHRLITYLADDLAEKVRPRYATRPGEREVLEIFERGVRPDVVVTRRPHAPPSVATAATTTLEAEAPVVLRLMEEDAREPYLEIRDLRSGGRVVTVIEILSPSNKRPGSDSRRKYLQKRQELLAGDVSVVEIDLLRGGEHTVAMPESFRGGPAPFHYLVVVRRAGRPREVEVYPIPLSRRLPRIRVPLAEPDPDVAADLQALPERAYEVAGYAEDLDYTMAPDPPLSDQDLAWARRILEAPKA